MVLTGVFVGVLLLVLLPARQPARAAIHYVINTNDTGTGSLRWPIEQANGKDVSDSIHFNITSCLVCAIAPASRTE